MGRADSGSIHTAFRLTLPDAEKAERWYVVLMAQVPYYGGPEGGGWWDSDTHAEAFQECVSRGQAERIAGQVRQRAATLARAAQRGFEEQCARELDWLEARGLPPEFLPEVDGPTEYSVIVSQGIPAPTYGSRRYE